MRLRNVSTAFSSWLQMAISRDIPCPGDVFFLAPAHSSTSQYRTWLESNGVDSGRIFTTLAAGYAALTANRNDVLCAMPGTYTVTESLAWAKDQTHIIGLGGQNQRYCPTSATNGAVKFYCTTATIDSILSVTANYNLLKGFQTQNTASDNANRCDIQILARNTHLKDVYARGGNGANQLNHADGGVPLIVASGTAGAGNGLLVEDCILGSAGNSARTVGAGSVLFEGGAAAGYNPVFKNSTFEARCETSGSENPKLIHLAGQYAVDRILEFDHCLFYAFYENLAGQMDYAIVDGCTTTHQIVLRGGCSLVGIDKWCNVATYCFTTDPLCHTNGGEALAVDATV
jgi:hypothetical protein